MAVKFFSVRSGEVVLAETEPMIAAYFNSSDLNPNGIVQDYGWRIHPNMAKRIKELEEDEEFIEKLADKLQVPVENVATYHILKYVSDRDDRENRKAAEKEDNKYQEQYERELSEALSSTGEKDNVPSSVVDQPKKGSKASKQKSATPAEIAAQKKIDDEKLALLIAEDDNKKS